MDKEKRTTREQIEQLAADIIHASEAINSHILTPRPSEEALARAYNSAMAIQFHADGILTALKHTEAQP